MTRVAPAPDRLDEWVVEVEWLHFTRRGRRPLP
jgi:hypothetical protein